MRRHDPARQAAGARTSAALTARAQPPALDEPSLTGWRSFLPRLPVDVSLRLHAATRWRARGAALKATHIGIRVLGGLVVVAAASSAFTDPLSAPGGESAVIVGSATVVGLVTVGLNLQSSEGRARMGRLLVFAGIAFALLLPLGSDDSLPFSVGWVAAAIVPVSTAYLLLAYPSGRLHSRLERRGLLGASLVIVVCWTALVLISPQPPFATSLLRCAPHCPSNVFFTGAVSGAEPVLRQIIRASWLLLPWFTVASLSRRMHSSSAPVRLSVAPLFLLSIVWAIAGTGMFLGAGKTGSVAESFTWVSLIVAPAIPLVMLLGLTRESLFMGDALSGFITRLGQDPAPDLQALMREAIHDPSLQISYRRPSLDAYVDSSGAPVAAPVASAQLGVTSIEHDGVPVALVAHDVELADQNRYIEAAGAAGVIWFRNAQLSADLKASVSHLAASRTRIVEAADAERLRIEHSLHDGAQQHLVGTRLRLELAAELMAREPERGMWMLAEIGDQIDEALEDVRNLAKGVYPPLLPEHGLGEAIRSVNRRSPWPASLDVDGIGRYPADTEVAVYFCCLEALQNITKHAGPEVGGAIRLWEDGGRLHFEVRDDGVGFREDAIEPGDGLVNMSDRMEAAGGTVTVTSHPGEGTTVRGSVPVAPRAARI